MHPIAAIVGLVLMLYVALPSRARAAVRSQLDSLDGVTGALDFGNDALIVGGGGADADLAGIGSFTDDLVEAGETVFSAGQALLEQLGQSARSLFQLPERAAPYAEAIREAEVKNSLPEGLLGRLLYQESRFRPDIIDGTTRSSAGATGIAQIIPKWHPGVDATDPFASIAYAGSELKKQFDRFGTWAQALAAYNWGPGNQQKDLRDGLIGNEWPKETRDYVNGILGDLGML